MSPRKHRDKGTKVPPWRVVNYPIKQLSVTQPFTWKKRIKSRDPTQSSRHCVRWRKKIHLTCTVPARMKKIQSKLKALARAVHNMSPIFSIINYVDFSRRSRVTPQSMVRSGRISNSFEILWLSLLECSQHCLHYYPMGTICCHGNHTLPPTPYWSPYIFTLVQKIKIGHEN